MTGDHCSEHCLILAPSLTRSFCGLCKQLTLVRGAVGLSIGIRENVREVEECMANRAQIILPLSELKIISNFNSSLERT